MSTEPPREHPSTYFVQDRSKQEEMDRLEIQDKMVTTGMGGVLPEQSDPANLRRVLDVGCGTGGWLIETAKTYPTIEKLVGVDVSGKMLEYAEAQAVGQGLGGRVRFQTADALRALPLSDDSFDLVNQRFGDSWLRTWEWRKILMEYRRVVRPGGIVRVTEISGLVTNSPALNKLSDIVLDVKYHSGRTFTREPDGLTRELARLMVQHGFQNIQTQVHALVYRSGTVEGKHFYEDMARLYPLIFPFLQRWTRVPSDYWEIYQQALKEMQAADFVATMPVLTVWGSRPNDEELMLMRGLQ